MPEDKEKCILAGRVSGPMMDRLVNKAIGEPAMQRPIHGIKENSTAAGHLAAARREAKRQSSICSLLGSNPQIAEFALIRAAAKLCAEGVEAEQFAVSVSVPIESGEDVLRDLAKRIAKVSKQLAIPISEISFLRAEQTRFSVTVSAMGTKPIRLDEELVDTEYSLVQCGFAGIEGTLLMYAKDTNRLSRLPHHVHEAALALEPLLDCRRAIGCGYENGAVWQSVYGEGGIFTGLWELGEKLRLGMDISLTEILIHQTTIEACELLDKNPYLMSGGGSVLMVTADAKRLLSALWAAGFEAERLGTLNTTANRVIHNAEETRNLEPFREDLLASL